MSHWRRRIGDHLDILLAETLRVAHDAGALKKSDLARVIIDTTVQPKNAAFPLILSWPKDRRQAAGDGDPPARQAGQGT